MTTGSSKSAIVLTGFMGAAKSSTAREIARVLGEPLQDVDILIQERLGEPITDFWEREGEGAFRTLEHEIALKALDRGGVVALGGGAIETPEVREALARHVTIYLEIDADLAWDRTRGGGRPLAVDRKAFDARLKSRRPFYESVARAIVPGGRERRGIALAPWVSALRSAPEVKLAWGRSISGEYPALVGSGAIRLIDADAIASRRAGGPKANGLRTDDSGSIPSRLFAIADREAIGPHRGLMPQLAATIEIDGGEELKTMERAEQVLRDLADQGARRDDAVLAVGGGVVGDLAGFCAAVYQRGIPVVQVPTTLLAQVDSAYGGKTGVDLPTAKNYVGAYHMPRAVLADPAVLATLPQAELAAGMAEVIKTGLIAGGGLWERVRSLGGIDPGRASAELGDVIFDCARTKLAVVAADERDSGRRAVLNLGHTVGHAIETVSNYSRYRHGEAVALGMLAVLRLSGAEGLRDEVAEICQRHGLPTSLDPAIDAEAVVDATAKDKKRTATGLGFVLIERPGEPREGCDVDRASVLSAVRELHT